MSREKLKRRALGLLGQSAALGGPLELPEGVVAFRVYGTGVPPEGVVVSREDLENGVVAVSSGPPQGGPHTMNGRSLI